MTTPQIPEEERDHLWEAPGFTVRMEWPPGERTYFIGIGRGTFSLYVSPDSAYHFDLEGRLRRASTPGRHYLRGLDGAVLRKLTSRGEPPQGEATSLEPGETLEVFRSSDEAVRGGLETLRRTGAESADPVAKREALDLLARAARYSPARLAEEAARFRQVYEPLSILPPDRYRALILQATVGCSWGRCAFCSLYRAVDYRQKSPHEFREHVRAVKAFLGRALELKAGVFLGEANALDLPARDLLRILEIVREEVPGQVETRPGNRGGISAFCDVFGGPFHAASTLRAVSRLGVDRIYLGIESGDDATLRGLRKPATRREAEDRVRVLKESGLAVGLIFLVGAGGAERARAHVEATVDLVRGLPLGERDQVYLSPLLWRERAATAPSVQLPESPGPADLRTEERELTERIRSLGVRVSRYDLTSFIYY